MKFLKNLFTKVIFPVVVPVVLAIIGANLINTYVFFIAVVPTGSMLPTIPLQERLIVTSVWNTEKLERGEIVVFYSEELEEMLIKRLIGLPGDTVEIRPSDDGYASVWVNGEKIDEPYVVNNIKISEEQVFNVPDEHYLFLGDNRAGSWDSRFWDNPYIHSSDIKGKATYTTKFQLIDKNE